MESSQVRVLGAAHLVVRLLCRDAAAQRACWPRICRGTAREQQSTCSTAKTDSRPLPGSCLADGDDQLVPLLEAAAYYLPQQAQQQQQQPADAVMLHQLSATHAQLAAAAAAAGAPRAQRPARRQRKVLRFLPY